MSVSLEQFSDECRNILTEKSGADALEGVRQALEKVLIDDAFVAQNIGPDETAGRKVLFEDPKLGFTICAHARGNKAESPPHDHGASWAIYGQVAGETHMTDWRKLSARARRESLSLLRRLERAVEASGPRSATRRKKKTA